MVNLKLGFFNGWLFMSVFILQMIVMMLVNKQVQERTHLPSEIRRSKKEKSVSIIANVIWLMALIYSVFLPLQFDSIFFYIGLLVFLLGLLFLVVATYDFMTSSINDLITKGIYRVSRHPMYVATFLICLGTGIATAAWTFIVLSIGIFICFREEALLEERICLEKYGEIYHEYMQSVPRWIGIPGKGS